MKIRAIWCIDAIRVFNKRIGIIFKRVDKQIPLTIRGSKALRKIIVCAARPAVLIYGINGINRQKFREIIRTIAQPSTAGKTLYAI